MGDTDDETIPPNRPRDITGDDGKNEDSPTSTPSPSQLPLPHSSPSSTPSPTPSTPSNQDEKDISENDYEDEDDDETKNHQDRDTSLRDALARASKCKKRLRRRTALFTSQKSPSSSSWTLHNSQIDLKTRVTSLEIGINDVYDDGLETKNSIICEMNDTSERNKNRLKDLINEKHLISEDHYTQILKRLTALEENENKTLQMNLSLKDRVRKLEKQVKELMNENKGLRDQIPSHVSTPPSLTSRTDLSCERQGSEDSDSTEDDDDPTDMHENIVVSNQTTRSPVQAHQNHDNETPTPQPLETNTLVTLWVQVHRLCFLVKDWR